MHGCTSQTFLHEEAHLVALRATIQGRRKKNEPYAKNLGSEEKIYCSFSCGYRILLNTMAILMVLWLVYTFQPFYLKILERLDVITLP